MRTGARISATAEHRVHNGLVRPLCVAVLAALAGCPDPPPYAQFRGPDGRYGWIVIDCRHHGGCLEKADRYCPEGYRVADDEGGDVSASHASLNSHTMMVKCKEERRRNPEEP